MAMSISQRPLVMLGFADSLAAIETTWSLLDNGYDVVALAKGNSKPALRWGRSVALLRVVSPHVDPWATVDDVVRLVRDLRPVAVMPLDDDMVWVGHQAALRADLTLLPRSDQTEYAIDKRAQLRIARKVGLAVPPTVFVEADDDWSEVSTFPLVVKPALAAELLRGALGRQRSLVCQDFSQLAQARRSLLPPLLVQPLIRGVGEGVFGLATPNGVTAWSGHRRVRMMNPQGSGASACVSKDVDADLREEIGDFVTAAGWRGMFMVELLRGEDGTPWFMELNGRAWGSMALARRRGFAYPAWTVQSEHGLPLEPGPPRGSPQVLCRHVGRELVHLAFVARGPSSGGADESWPRLGRTVADLVSVSRNDRLYNFRRSEPAVFLSDTWQTVAAQVRKGSRKP
jgi:hypothetical protein